MGLSFRFSTKDVHVSDWFSLAAALLAIPVWVVTKNPLWSLFILIGIEIFAYYQTFRKSWFNPYQEGAQYWFLGSVMSLISILALDRYTLTTYLYPGTMALINFMLVTLLILRRRTVQG